MQLWLRLVIVWFVAIALPVQGIAGVTMAHCGSSHARMAAALDAAQHAHAGHAHHHDAGATPDVPAPAKAGKLPDRAGYTCSSCAACCAGTALPSAMPRVPDVQAEPAAFADVTVAVDAFASDGPDRPPRARPV